MKTPSRNHGLLEDCHICGTKLICCCLILGWRNGILFYPLVMTNIAMENDHRNSGFSHQIYSNMIILKFAMWVYQMAIIAGPVLSPWWNLIHAEGYVQHGNTTKRSVSGHDSATDEGGKSPQNTAKNKVPTCLHLRILKFPLISWWLKRSNEVLSNWYSMGFAWHFMVVH